MTRLQKQILGAMIGIAALVVVLKRRLQPIRSTPLLPAPPAEAPEPPRIILPAEVLSSENGIAEAAHQNNISLPVEAASASNQAPAAGMAATAPAESSEPTEYPQAYCVSCREKRDVVDPHEETLENGRLALRGTCPICGSNVFRFLPSKSKE